MNYLAAGAATLGIIGSQLAASALGNDTSIPIGWMAGSGLTIFFTGMWVSSKVTKFEEQQLRNMQRLDAIERRLEHLEGKRH